MSPRDYMLKVEGHNQKIKSESDNELMKLRFARTQAFFSYCSVHWKGKPASYQQFCREIMPLPGDEVKEKPQAVILTPELHKQSQTFTND